MDKKDVNYKENGILFSIKKGGNGLPWWRSG